MRKKHKWCFTILEERTVWGIFICLTPCDHWRRKRQPTPVFLPGKSHGQRSLIGYSPLGRKESDTTKRLHMWSPKGSVQKRKMPLVDK